MADPPPRALTKSISNLACPGKEQRRVTPPNGTGGQEG